MPSSSPDQKASQPDAYAARGLPSPYLAQHNLTAWGIDPSSHTLYLVMLPGSPKDVPMHRVHPFSDRDAPLAERLSAIARDTREAALTQINEGHLPGVIAIEQPHGAPNKRHPTTDRAFTAILIGLQHALRWRGLSIPFYTPRPPEWKIVTGKGNASKTEVDEWFQRAYGYRMHLQDLHDAAAIATYARQQTVFLDP